MNHLLRRLNDPRVDAFLRAWPASTETWRPPEPVIAAVTRHIGAMPASAPPFAGDLVGCVVAACAGLAWRQSYRAPLTGRAFLENYAYCQLVGPDAPMFSARLAAGLLLLGPHTRYPAHRHEAEEIYVPLVGTARWWHGIRPWEPRQPGEVIHHPSDEPHAMQAGAAPLLAIYLWRSEDLSQRARFVSAQPMGAAVTA